MTASVIPFIIATNYGFARVRRQHLSLLNDASPRTSQNLCFSDGLRHIGWPSLKGAKMKKIAWVPGVPAQQIHWPIGSSGRFQRFQTLHCYRKSVWQEVLRRSSCQTEMRIQHPHQPFFCCMRQGNLSTGVLPKCSATQNPWDPPFQGRSARRSPAAPRGSDWDKEGQELRPSPRWHRASPHQPVGLLLGFNSTPGKAQNCNLKD